MRRPDRIAALIQLADRQIVRLQAQEAELDGRNDHARLRESLERVIRERDVMVAMLNDAAR